MRWQASPASDHNRDEEQARLILTDLASTDQLHRVLNWHILQEYSSYYRETTHRLVFEVEDGFSLNDCITLRTALDATKLDLYITQTYELAPQGWHGPRWGSFGIRLPQMDLGGFTRPPLVLAPQSMPINDDDTRIQPYFRNICAEAEPVLTDMLARLKITEYEFANYEPGDYRSPAVFFRSEEDAVLFKMAL